MAFITDSWKVDFMCFFISIFTIVAYYVKYSYGYWQRKGIELLKPTFPFGNFGKMFRFQASIADLMIDVYRSTNKPYIGIYGFLRPILVIRDVDLMRRIMIKDFSYFPNRGTYLDEKNEPLSAHLFNIEDKKWKTLRTKFSPTFTSVKLKSMYGTLVSCRQKLDNRLNQLAANNEIFDVRELSAGHSTNVIASVAFGLEVDCIKDPDTDFRVYGRKVFAPTIANGIRNTASQANPEIMKMLKLKLFPHDASTFFMDMIRQNLDYREDNNVVRKDFFQILIQLKNGIAISEDDRWTNLKSVDGKQQLTFNEIAAQAFIFYLAGFETSSATLSWCVYELAKNAEVQRRAQEEVTEVLQRFNGEFSYEALSELKYLEMCLDETLRKYPPLPILSRKASHEYPLPDSNIVLEKGTEITIPIVGVQRDENYYPDPEKFDPERFSEESKASPEYAKRPYFPFGGGQRNCIGMRMGKMSTKSALAVMLEKYTYELSDEQKKRKVAFAAESFILAPVGGIELKIKKRF